LGIGAGVLKVAGGVLALALVRPWGRRVPRRLLAGVAWAASVVLTLYGGLLVAVGALVLAGVIGPAGPVDRTALRWHVLLWDLWFLVWVCCWAWRPGLPAPRRVSRNQVKDSVGTQQVLDELQFGVGWPHPEQVDVDRQGLVEPLAGERPPD
jgi:hypothetical protein